MRHADAEAALADCVKAFNVLDAKHRFIFTIEREDLHAALVTIAVAAGVARDRATTIIDTCRDW